MDFTGLDPRFVLTGVTLGQELVTWSSIATILEVEHNGQKYAGKKMHDILDRIEGSIPIIINRFMEECRLLSQLHHPNIVQFVGLYFHQGERVPILVMELHPTNLDTCIEKYGILPKDIAYSILHDVAQGLHYLHCQSPPIMHLNLAAHNVLLTSKISAKICGFGSARSLDTNSRLLRNPGAPLYMPPEASLDDPRYDTSIDVFSYGIVMVYMFSGKFPVALKPVFSDEGVRSEAERREEYLQAIGNDHPAMKLILQCIANDPKQRPTATELSQQIKRICQYDGKCPVVHTVYYSCIFVRNAP